MTDIDELHPPHDIPPREPLPTSVLAEWETGTFIENLAPWVGVGWWVTIPSHRRVELVATDGTRLSSVAFAGQVTGVVAEPGGTAIVSGERAEGGWALHRVLPSIPTPQRLCDLPGVQFANGLVRYRSRLVVADSAAGRLTVADPVAGTARVALEHELLAPVDPHGPLPGVNGLTVDAAGDLLLTNTSRSLLLRLHGEPEQGRLTRQAERLVGDDLVAHPDGTVYIATHTYNSILRLTPDGRRLDIATDADGVVGPTSVALAPDRRSLVTCTTGGLLSPPPSGPQPARLVRIDLDPASGSATP